MVFWKNERQCSVGELLKVWDCLRSSRKAPDISHHHVYSSSCFKKSISLKWVFFFFFFENHISPFTETPWMCGHASSPKHRECVALDDVVLCCPLHSVYTAKNFPGNFLAFSQCLHFQTFSENFPHIFKVFTLPRIFHAFSECSHYVFFCKKYRPFDFCDLIASLHSSRRDKAPDISHDYVYAISWVKMSVFLKS